MERPAATSSVRRVGDGTRLFGRTVIAGGIAIGLMFGLSWWLAGCQADRAPVSEEAFPRGGTQARPLPPALPSSGAPESAVPAPPLPSESAPTSLSAPASAPALAPAPVQVRPPDATVAPPPPTTRPPVVVAARYATTSSWDTGYVAQIVVTTGAAGAQYFDLRLQLPAGVTVVDYWSNSASGPRRSADGGAVTFHDGPVSAGRSVVVGFQARKDPALVRPHQFEPSSCTVNGDACS